MAQEESENRDGPMGRLKGEVGELAGALSNRAVTSLLDRVQGTSSRLNKYVEGGGGPGIMAAVTGAKGIAEGKSPGRSMLGAGMAGIKEKVSGLFRRGGKGGGSKKLKLTNIVESIDVGVPVTLAYNQWTQYNDFPKFTKKVENADKTGDEDEEQKINWKAQVFWSHRTWEATVIEQVPDERIIWRSKGQKGHVDGAVTFHELGPNLTRILLVLEYHPQGMFERTGNLWRAQGRRARLELKHFGRHMMTQGVLHPDDFEGWRGTIHDSEVVETHEDALEREQQESPDREESRQAGDGQVDDEGRDGSEEGEEGEESGRRRRAAETTTDERDEGDERGDEEGDGRGDEEGEGEESGNGRVTAARSRAGRSSRSRSSGTRSTGNAGGGNGRRQRAGATARRGGNR
jgi:polyketide cyclase/dehydrase/lipid transport protein